MSKSKFPEHLALDKRATREIDANGNEHVWIPSSAEQSQWMRMSIRDQAEITTQNEGASSLAVRIQEYREFKRTLMQRLLGSVPDNVVDAPIGKDGAKVPLSVLGKSRKALLVWARQNGLRLDPEAVSRLFINTIAQQELLDAWLVEVSESSEETPTREPGRSRLTVPKAESDVQRNVERPIQTTTDQTLMRIPEFPSSGHRTEDDESNKEAARTKRWIQASLLPLLESFGKTGTITLAEDIPLQVREILNGLQGNASPSSVADYIKLLDRINCEFTHTYGLSIADESSGIEHDRQKLWGCELRLDNYLLSRTIVLNGVRIRIDVTELLVPRETNISTCNILTGVIRLVSEKQPLLSLTIAEKAIRENLPLAGRSLPALRNVIVGTMVKDLRYKYHSDRAVLKADKRQALSHELGHMQAGVRSKVIGSDPTPEIRHKTANYILPASSMSQIRSLWDISSKSSTKKMSAIYDLSIDELHAHMIDLVEEPRQEVMNMAIKCTKEAKNEFELVYIIVARCCLVLLAQDMGSRTPVSLQQAWELPIQNGNCQVMHTLECVKIAQELVQHPENQLRLAIKRVFEREFGTPIDEPPFAKIGPNGELISRLQVPDELLE